MKEYFEKNEEKIGQILSKGIMTVKYFLILQVAGVLAISFYYQGIEPPEAVFFAALLTFATIFASDMIVELVVAIYKRIIG